MRFQISDNTTNTYDYRILTSGGRFERWNANPIVLFDHNDRQVLGRGENLTIEGEALMSDVVFDNDDAQLAGIIGKIERGFIRMASVGVVPLKWMLDSAVLTNGEPTPTVVEWELREWSITPFGSNRGSIVLYDNAGGQLDLSDRTTLLQLCDGCNPEIPIIKPNTMKLTTKTLELLQLTDVATEAEIEAKLLTLHARATDAEAKLAKIETDRITAQKVEAVTLTDAAIADGRINADSKPVYLNLFDGNFAAAKAALAAIPKRPTVASQIGTEGKEDKLLKLSWDEAYRNNQLEKLKERYPERYAELYAEKFGK